MNYTAMEKKSSMNYKAVFVDTWGWMALGYRREPRHAEVKCIYQELRSNRIPIHTSDYVLDEVITLLFRRERFDEATHFVEGIFAAAALGQVRIERVTTDRFLEAWELRKRFQDKPGISFTDLISMLIMKELDICQVLTEDEHFAHVGMGFSRLP
jgi:predicted nucleic acid-binding protein